MALGLPTSPSGRVLTLPGAWPVFCLLEPKARMDMTSPSGLFSAPDTPVMGVLLLLTHHPFPLSRVDQLSASAPCHLLCTLSSHRPWGLRFPVVYGVTAPPRKAVGSPKSWVWFLGEEACC